MTSVAGRRHRPVEFLDRGGLARDLGGAVEGEVRFDPGSTALYANDASIYRQVPVGVVVPRHAGDVEEALAVCRRYDVPVLGRGCGTGLAGQSVNAAVVFDFTKYMNEIVELDPEGRTARVQPGVICDQLRGAAGEHGLTFAVDPATHDRCTLGGMIGNNSCGTHSVMGGKTVDNVLELDVITYDGTRMTVGAGGVPATGREEEIYRGLHGIAERYGHLIRERYPDIPRRVSGYNLDSLLPEQGFDVAKALVGSESTCVLVLEARVRLMHDPDHHALLVIGYPDAVTAAEHVPELLETDGLIGLECFDAGVIDNLNAHGEHIPGIDDLPEGGAWLLAEYGAESQDEANGLCEAVRARPHGGRPKLFLEAEGQEQIWEVRRSTIEYTRLPRRHSGLAGWEDAAVAPEKLADYLRDYCDLVERHGYHTVLFGHFGQGCMHNRLDLDLQTPDGVENLRRFLEEAGDLVVRYGGSLSGEHGDGQLRANQLAKMFGPELVEAFAEFKDVFDPSRKMNPGKIVAPYRPDQNLRLGTDYRPREVTTYFRYPEDERGFADAANRCFGIGKCRHLDGGTMCPSFMVTREEKHSTRGRARLLFEMMSGPLSDDGWRDEHVKDALDLCLSCKGCKGDCPVSVDMATYKAEFLAHYYKGRLRPRQAYALGLIPIWARLGSKVPGLVNALLHGPVTGRALRLAAGIEPDRAAPALAARTFRDWFATHQSPGGRPVMLWPDTFTDFFAPEIGVAAVGVLEDAGYEVRLPEKRLCCGRPLFDYGMLPTARRWLRRDVDALAEPISDGVPLVGLEPSCLAVFRDELTNLFPDDAGAHRLARGSFTLAELLAGDGYEPPALDRDALVQVHCHQGAVLTHDSERDLLERAGLRLHIPDSGCCGMAGSFGYERGDRYDVAQAAGERVILPAVRDAPDTTVIVADGFSCREQIVQNTGRRPLHLAQVLRLPAGAHRGRPEDGCRETPPKTPLTTLALGAAATAVTGATVAAGARALRRFLGGS